VVALVVAVVMVATGHDWPSLTALIVAAWLGVGMAQLVGQADQGIREERLIYEWLLMILGPVP
jgi:hypothetical protein